MNHLRIFLGQHVDFPLAHVNHVNEYCIRPEHAQMIQILDGPAATAHARVRHLLEHGRKVQVQGGPVIISHLL